MIGRKWEGMLYSISLSNEIVPKFRLIPLIGISSWMKSVSFIQRKKSFDISVNAIDHLKYTLIFLLF